VRSACQMLCYVQIMLGHFSSRSFDRMFAPASRELPLMPKLACRVDRKDFNMHDRAVMVNAFAIMEAGGRGHAQRWDRL